VQINRGKKMQMHPHIQDLHHGLKDFGLNPKEWCLEVQCERGNPLGATLKYGIHSLLDENLVLEGWAVQNVWLNVCYCGSF